ncbi:MAG: aspartate--ammonia ligase [Dysgonamonadaceae bacterium]|nr:aspartate--ammonia ligase [Dysgonamonadaceae bacterium]
MSYKAEHIIIPQNYRSSLSVIETEKAIKLLKDFFEDELAKKLNLIRVSAPLFVRHESGLNDNLNGVERPVSFDVKCINADVEIVHSLAKWKRMALKKYGFKSGQGLYTDMNAIRRDDQMDNFHSIYVDQWDWEKVIEKTYRNKDYLKSFVNSIFDVFKSAEDFICERYPQIPRKLPDEIFFITTQELEDLYPNLDPEQREFEITKEKKAVFIMEIGDVLKSGITHGGRAPDYDDWHLNGDILFWYPLLNKAVELSSMGIRVDEKALYDQLSKANCLERKKYDFHRDLLNGELPYTIGGGIGQSRLCMFFLEKAHIGEVQASAWDEVTLKMCEDAGVHLL